MSNYVRQYADRPGEWFHENPPDAREGDEIQVGGGWHVMSAYQLDACLLDNQPRRRLIAPGEGFRILGVNEVPPTNFEYTTDGITWKTDTWSVNHYYPIRKMTLAEGAIAIRQRIPVGAGRNDNMMPTPDPRIQAVIDAAREYVDKANSDYGRDCALDEYSTLESALTALGEDVCASCGHTKLDHQYITCPQFKPKEPTKDDEWPRYWLWRNVNLHKVEEDGATFFWDTLQQNWIPKGIVSSNFYHEPHYKRITPAAAQARMEGKAVKGLVIDDIVCTVCSGYVPGHATGAGDLCCCEPITIQKPPSQDEFEEWRAQFPMFSETVIAIGESAVKDYIKWHAAKVKGGEV